MLTVVSWLVAGGIVLLVGLVAWGLYQTKKYADPWKSGATTAAAPIREEPEAAKQEP